MFFDLCRRTQPFWRASPTIRASRRRQSSAARRLFADLQMVPIECRARLFDRLPPAGLISELVRCGIALRKALTEASKFDAPLFTPATKAEFGEHDENISFEQAGMPQ